MVDKNEFEKLPEKLTLNQAIWLLVLLAFSGISYEEIQEELHKDDYVEKYFKDCKGLLNNNKGEIN